MLYESLFNIAKKFPNKLALNNLTYSQLIDKINHRKYIPVTNNIGTEIILDIFRASQVNKSITVLPLNPSNIQQTDIIDEFNLILYSSGSTNLIRKPIILNSELLLSNALNAVVCQRLTENDRILTVCSLNHTGGLNAQTIPALLIGAHVILQPFDHKTFFNSLEQHKITVTHIIPKMTEVLNKLKRKTSHRLRLITTGSDCVYKNHIQYWLQHSQSVVTNYGLTQAGPILINHQFTEDSNLSIFDKGIVLGDKIWCDYIIQENELIIKGSNVVTGLDWFHTDDCIELIDNWFIYKGRKSAGCKIIPKKY